MQKTRGVQCAQGQGQNLSAARRHSREDHAGAVLVGIDRWCGHLLHLVSS